MKSKVTTLTATALALLFAGSTFAANTGQQKSSQQGSQKKGTQVQQASNKDMMSTEWLTGATVYSPRAEELGTITNLIMDRRQGNVQFAIINTGGIFEVEDEKYVVPYSALSISRDRVTMNMDRQKLSQAPKWREGMNFEQFNRQTYEFFGVSPEWGEGEIFQERGGVFEEGGGVIE